MWKALFILCVGSAIVGAQTPAPIEAGPTGCGGRLGPGSVGAADRTLAFAAGLAELGPRPAAGEAEARTRSTVAAQLEAIGLDVVTEDFDYSTFAIDAISLSLGGTPADPEIVGVDPYKNKLTFLGEAVIVTDPAEASDALKGRIVVTDHPFMQLMIAGFEPGVVICVKPEDLKAFAARGNLEVSLEIKGRTLVLRSANLVARSGPRQPAQPEILVTSHLDAYRDSPGANDNATGLGLMIELARSFAGNTGPDEASITFVAFGAEENGAIGSRAYVQHHAAELGNVIAVVNLDTLGGALGPVIATKPSEPVTYPEGPGVHVPEGLRNRAWEGPDGRWRIIHPEIIPAAFTSNYPEWLYEIVTRSAADLEIEIVHLDLISDHRTFALAGVPAISIQSREHHIHSTEDTADVLVPETIDACARLAADILCRLQTRPDGPADADGKGSPDSSS